MTGFVKARTDLVRHASFVAAVDDWERSDRDPGYLVTGARLAEYEKWAGASRLDLNARELQFLGASLQAREREVRADQERTEREVRLDRRARRRLWAAVGAVVMLVVFVGTLVVATALNDTTRVAVVTSGEEDALSKLLIRGVEQAAADLPVEIMDVIPPITDLRREYRRLASAGVELIIVPAGLDGGELFDIAAEEPDVTFVVVMGLEAEGSPNVVAVEFAEEQAGFLAGVAAAAETKNGVVGFIGGAAVPDVETRRAGFEAGVAFVDPSVTVLARHVSANGDGVRAFQRTDLGKAAVLGTSSTVAPMWSITRLAARGSGCFRQLVNTLKLRRSSIGGSVRIRTRSWRSALSSKTMCFSPCFVSSMWLRAVRSTIC